MVDYCQPMDTIIYENEFMEIWSYNDTRPSTLCRLTEHPEGHLSLVALVNKLIQFV